MDKQKVEAIFGVFVIVSIVLLDVLAIKVLFFGGLCG